MSDIKNLRPSDYPYPQLREPSGAGCAAMPGSRSSETPETDEAWECEHPLYRRSDNEKRALAAKLERQRNQLAKLLEREIEDINGSGDEIGAKQLRRAVREILPENDQAG